MGEVDRSKVQLCPVEDSKLAVQIVDVLAELIKALAKEK